MDPSKFRFDLSYFADEMLASEVGVLTIVQALLEQAPIPASLELNVAGRETLETACSPTTLSLSR
jgi:hypothetical protein